MNEYRPISAESQHNFHILPNCNSKTTEPIFTIFSHSLELLVKLLARASARRLYISFQNTIAKSKDGQFRRWQKSPKINWLPWKRPLDYCENYGSLIICMHASTKAETLVTIGSAVVEKFGDIGQFRSSRSTIFIFYPTLTPKLLNQFSPFFSHDLQLLVELLTRASARR